MPEANLLKTYLNFIAHFLQCPEPMILPNLVIFQQMKGDFAVKLPKE